MLTASKDDHLGSEGDIGGRLTLSANAMYVGQVVTWAAAKLPH
jgi:hypothetical protein